MLTPTLDSAIQYLNSKVQNESLIQHSINVGKCMKYYAEKLKSGEIKTDKFSSSEIENINTEYWQVAGILHDSDWESNPDKHPAVTVQYLTSINFPTEIIQAINSHADLDWIKRENLSNEVEVEGEIIHRSIPRVSILDKFLFACDELSGFVTAVGKVRPNGITDLEPKSVIKRLKEKSFAAGVNRDDIYRSVEEIGIPLEEHVRNVVEGLK